MVASIIAIVIFLLLKKGIFRVNNIIENVAEGQNLKSEEDVNNNADEIVVNKNKRSIHNN